jgi:hypothetical protein
VFGWIKTQTRDAILEGAAEAAHILRHGTDAATERTEVVARFEESTDAPPPGVRRAGIEGGNGAAKPAALPPAPEGRGQDRPRGPMPPARREAGRDVRTPAKSSKTEAMFDAGGDAEAKP